MILKFQIHLIIRYDTESELLPCDLFLSFETLSDPK